MTRDLGRETKPCQQRQNKHQGFAQFRRKPRVGREFLKNTCYLVACQTFQKRTYSHTNKIMKLQRREKERKTQPVIKTRCWSASKNEVEWKLASIGICRGEVPRNRLGRTGARQPQAGLGCIQQATRRNIRTTGRSLRHTCNTKGAEFRKDRHIHL